MSKEKEIQKEIDYLREAGKQVLSQHHISLRRSWDKGYNQALKDAKRLVVKHCEDDKEFFAHTSWDIICKIEALEKK